MKIIIFIFILNSLMNAEEVFGMDKKEFQAMIFNNMLDGAKGIAREAKKLIINPPDLKKQRIKQNNKNICQNKRLKMYTISTKYWWKLRKEEINCTRY